MCGHFSHRPCPIPLQQPQKALEHRFSPLRGLRALVGARRRAERGVHVVLVPWVLVESAKRVGGGGARGEEGKGG